MSIKVTKVTKDLPYRVIIGVNTAVEVIAQGEAGDPLEDVLQAAASQIDNTITITRDGKFVEKVLVSDSEGSREATDPREIIAPGATIVRDQSKDNG